MIKIGTFTEHQVRDGEDKKEVERLQKITGLEFVHSELNKKQDKLTVYLMSKEEFYARGGVKLW